MCASMMSIIRRKELKLPNTLLILLDILSLMLSINPNPDPDPDLDPIPIQLCSQKNPSFLFVEHFRSATLRNITHTL